MNLLSSLMIGLVALLHIYFLILEMFLWTKPMGLKVFRQSQQKANDSAVLAANQGLYNGFLAAGLLWGLISSNLQFQVFFLSCVIIAGFYGGLTVGKKIFMVQAVPALIALALVFIS